MPPIFTLVFVVLHPLAGLDWTVGEMSLTVLTVLILNFFVLTRLVFPGGIAEEAALSFLFFTSMVRLGQGQSSSSFAASKASLTVNRVEVAWP